MTTKSTDSAVAIILEALAGQAGWVRVGDIAGLSAEEMEAGVLELLECDDFRAEPEPVRARITSADRALAPTVGGEPRHLLRFM
jgi:hypothetical protein